MRKFNYKTFFLGFILISVILMAIITGYSSWVIGEKKVITPTYNFEDLFEQKLSFTATYSAKEMSIDLAENGKINIKKENFNIYYLDNEGNEITYPVNAGTYKVKIESKTLLEADGVTKRAAYVNFIINKATPQIDLAKNFVINNVNDYITTSSTMTDLTVTDPNGVVHHGESSSKSKVDGTFSLPNQTLVVGNNEYDCSFTPTDTENFTSLDFKIKINVFATIRFESSGSQYGDLQYIDTYNNQKITKPTTDPITEQVGYTFGYWSFVDSEWDFNTNIIDSDMTLVSTFVPIVYTISYNLDGGTVETPNPENYTIETDDFTLNNPTKKNATFNGWIEKEAGALGLNVTISKGTTGNKEYTATWLIKYDISKPIADDTVFVYNGQNQTYSLEENAAYTISNNVQKNAGTYEVIVSLTDKEQYSWEDGSKDDLIYSFEIAKKDITITFGTMQLTNATIPEAGSTIEYSDNIKLAISNITVNGLVNGESNTDAGINYIYSLDNGKTTQTSETSTSIENTFIQTTEQTMAIGMITGKVEVSCGANYNISNTNNKTVESTINRLRIYTNATILEQSITDTRTWATAQTFLQNNVTFNRYLTHELCSVSVENVSCLGIQDGTFKYGTPSENSSLTNNISIITNENNDLNLATNASTYLVGSTYYAYYKVTSPYEIVNSSNGTTTDISNRLTYKYKSVYVGGSYYTIEDALSNQTGNAFMWGDATSGTTYGFTKFTSLSEIYNKTEYILSSRNIYAPYTLNSSTLKDANGTGTNVFSCLYIPEDITITLNGSSILAACSSIANGAQGGTATAQRGVIYNNGIINANGTTKVYAYGYIKGMGKLNLNESSKAYDVLRTYNWCGGSAASNSNMSSGLLNKDFIVTPFTEYMIHNISCETKISSSCEYYGYFKTTVSSTNADAEVVIIGTSSTSSCLFKPAASNSNNFLIKKAANAVNASTNTNLYQITGSSQVKEQKDIIDICGSYTDCSFSLTVKLSLGSGTLTTSTSLVLPISYMQITIKNGATLALTNSDYMFMPGTSLTIEENAKCTVGTNVDLNIASFSVINSTYMKDCVDKFDAKVTVNGTLEVLGNIGGFVDSTSTSGKLSIKGSTSSYYDLYYATSDPYRTKGNFTLSGYVLTSATSRDLKSMPNGEYVCQNIGNDEYAWGQPEGKIVYVLNNGSENVDGSIHSLYGGCIISEPEISNPTKQHYTFGGWYTDETFVTEAFPCTLYSSVMVYAKWIPIDYELSYNITFEGCTEQSITNGNSNTYNNDSSFTLYPAECADYIFDGWYSDSAFSDKVTVIYGNNIISQLSSPYTYHLYGRFYPAGTETYTITYSNAHPEIVSTPTDIEEIVSINLGSYTAPDLSMYNSNTTKQYYFDGWYLDNSYTTKLTDPATQINTSLTLYANWLEKSVVRFNFVGSSGLEELLSSTNRYVYANQSITVPDLESSLGLSSTQISTLIGKGRTLDQFYCIGGAVDKQFINKGDSVIFSNDYGQTIDLWPAQQKYMITISFSGSNAQGTITITPIIDNDNHIYSSTPAVKDKSVTNGEEITVHYNDNYQCHETSGGSVSTSSGVITDNITITYTGKKGGCFATGTNILLADGTYKKIEEINVGDTILSFNHELGIAEEQIVTFIPYHSTDIYKVLELQFENGKVIKVLFAHGFLNSNTRKYEEISYDNVSSMIGNKYVFMDEQGQITNVELISYQIYEEVTECYSLSTAYNLNHFVEGALCISDDIRGLYNYFEIDENLRYDEVLKAKDIEKYGLLSYEDVSDFMSFEIYELFNVQYLSVSIGKGLITIEIMKEYIEKFA